MKTSTSVYFDSDEALAIVDGDWDLFRELVTVFRQTYPAEMSLIRDAIRLRDAAALQAASHQFKGTLSALAAGPARATAVRLEDIGRKADLAQAADIYAEMEQQVRALDAALSGWG
jgi:HPt (histidine-containing phosphotransfer) domain-containing protein